MWLTEEVARYIEAAKSYQGAKVHAWMFTVNAPGDSAALAHPEWFDVNRIGYNSHEYDPYVKHYKWLSPSVPEARRYMKDKAASYAALEGLTSVHLDLFVIMMLYWDDAYNNTSLRFSKIPIALNMILAIIR